ncbi:hypothetical protein JMJ35_003657 [Cladonia borealis]|uniref:Zn(2)-C6 fungal-type domain-containing protein n=1 Tax=Cladonia borealis TaxID=184061 RepID=A0AA39R507_9LECA|nr:hypothetical protein JMJ35_003657 [Cladonia borealis]
MSFMRYYEDDSPPPPEFDKWQHELFGDFSNDLHAGLETALTSKYDLRPAAREASKLVTITWIDQDESGTYDPAGKRSPSPLPNSRKRRERYEHAEDDAPKRPKTSTWRMGRFRGSQMIVTFKITTEHGVAWQRSVGVAHDNWPQPLPSTYQMQSSGSSDDSSTDDNCKRLQPYEFRQRPRHDFPGASVFNGCELPDLADVTVGHPAARGCKGCFAKREDCPLLEEGSRYPCETCRADDIDCELIIQPPRKRACEVCSKRRLVCSYREEGSDHAQPCRECAKAGLKCVAGPLSGRTRIGPSLDQDRPGRKKGCTQCSRAKKWCSLKNKNPSLPCNLCRDNGEECSFEPLKRQFRKRRSKKKRRSQVSVEKELTSGALVKQDPKRFRTITTKLAHPINFNYVAKENDPLLCHWCDDLVHGLLGLGSVEVEVLNNEDGQGLTEVVDGHTAKGHLPSRMCGFCTLDRLKIAACKVHEVEPLADMEPACFDYNSVINWMAPGQAALAPFPWCSICPAPAFFACCSETDEIDVLGYGQDEADGKGCGLLLCESCAVTLVNEHDGVLEGLIDGLKEEEEEGGFSLRADADFLHPKGELLRRMAAA